MVDLPVAGVMAFVALAHTHVYIENWRFRPRPNQLSSKVLVPGDTTPGLLKLQGD